MSAFAEAAYDPSHQRKAKAVKNQRTPWIARMQQALSAQPQRDGGGKPESQAGAEEAKV